ncbi:MAG: response regulator [Steroidobacteraceae bacterium]|nr:response regulator [Deltaproteobacteria bacterium]
MSDTSNLRYADVTLLYVEDEASTREQVSRILTLRGYRLITRVNGQSGLDAYREHRPDIVLTDIMMPQMNGLEMVRRIRAMDPEAQVVCMTAFSETNYLIEAIDVGINQFVPKPVDLSRLLAALDHCLEIIELKKRHGMLEAETQKTRKLEAIGILAGGMAHDFNNLLQVILGYVSLARMCADPDSKTAELLGIAEKSFDNARQLGKRLLTLAKGGDAILELTHLPPLIIAGIEAELRGTSTSCVTDLPADLPPVRIDAAQFRHVISHLTINAREAMPQGGTLQVSASLCSLAAINEQALDPGDYLHIIFKDSGVGIAPENLPRIFDPYFTTKEMGSQKGMGLGLAISHSVLRHHRGQIQAESKPGEGTAFHIYLPLSQTNN